MSEFSNTEALEEMQRNANKGAADKAVVQEQKRRASVQMMADAREQMVRNANKAAADNAAEEARKEQVAEREAQQAKDKAVEQMVRSENQRKANADAEEARKEKMENTDIPMDTVDAMAEAQAEMLRKNAIKHAGECIEQERGRQINAENMKSAQEEMMRAASSKAADDAAAAAIAEAQAEAAVPVKRDRRASLNKEAMLSALPTKAD